MNIAAVHPEGGLPDGQTHHAAGPTEGGFLGLNTAWFAEALATATEREFGHVRLKLISPVAFLATKHIAFSDRGGGDYYASHDLEDFVTVIDGREGIVADVQYKSLFVTPFGQQFRAGAAEDDAIDGDAFTGADDEHVADLDVGRGDDGFVGAAADAGDVGNE